MTVHQDHPSLLLVVIAAVGVGYLAAAQRLRRRGDSWPRRRDASFVGGSVVLIAAVLVPGGGFTAHMLVHLSTGMIAPLLMVLGRPITLVLWCLRPRAVRRGLVAAAHSIPVAVLVFPPVAAVLDVGGLWALYRTPLYASMHHDALLTAAVHVHVFAAGLLFSLAICQVEPVRHRYGFTLRAVVLLAAGAAHAVLAKSLHAYPPPGLHSAVDLHAGAQLMYYGGDVVELALAAVLAVQWYVAAGRRRPHTVSGSSVPVASSAYWRISRSAVRRSISGSRATMR